MPVDRHAPGYCLDQLREKVFADIGEEPNKGLEIVSMTTSQSAIQDWFERLKNDIMTTKLRAVVAADNKNADWATEVSVNIDGKINHKTNWRPSRLYPHINVTPYCCDSAFTLQSVAYHKEYKNKENVADKIKLGQIKHHNWGFHLYDDDICFHLSQPTDYDNELAALGIKKPDSEVRVPVKKIIFTFILPFWLTAVLFLLLLWYIFMVVRAIKTNTMEYFRGTVDIYDSVGHQIGDTIQINNRRGKPVVIGDGGTNGCDVPGAAWAIVLTKETHSPLLFTKKPGFRWKAKKGFACSGNKKQGLIGRFDQKNMKKGFDIQCGSGFDNITHTVTLRIKKK